MYRHSDNNTKVNILAQKDVVGRMWCMFSYDQSGRRKQLQLLKQEDNGV